MNILFVCKYNRFRSQIAESYFRKINKNKSIKADSAGMIRGDYPLDRLQVSIAGRLGVKIGGKRPKAFDTNLLRRQDIIIIAADNVPKSIFKYKGRYIQRIIEWKIPDEENGIIRNNERIIRMVKEKVEDLVRSLK